MVEPPPTGPVGDGFNQSETGVLSRAVEQITTLAGAQHIDATLIALGRDLESAIADSDDEAAWAIVDCISAATARTREGLAVKARSVAFAFRHELDGGGSDARLLRSLIDDATAA